MKLLCFLLFPLAIVYDCVTTIRNFLYDKKIFKSTSFNIPVIAVGNISVGGTGKTPQIEYLIRLLEEDYKVAVLSRGYKRKSKGFLLVNSTHTAEDVGDEPLQFFKKFKNIKVAVDANRTNGITQLLGQKNPPEVVLLDDAFQHRKVKATAYILLTKYNDLYIDNFLLPTGNLRESRRGAKRANIVVVTKCPLNLLSEEKIIIRKKLNLKNDQQLFFSSIKYAEAIKGTQNILVKDLKKYKILLVTGIANSKPLLNFLEGQKVEFQHLNFPDHHHFTAKDIKKVNTAFKNILEENKLILTTEKDYVRLVNKLQDLSYLPIETSFLDRKKVFDNTIKVCINS